MVMLRVSGVAHHRELEYQGLLRRAELWNPKDRKEHVRPTGGLMAPTALRRVNCGRFNQHDATTPHGGGYQAGTKCEEVPSTV